MISPASAVKRTLLAEIREVKRIERYVDKQIAVAAGAGYEGCTVELSCLEYEIALMGLLQCYRDAGYKVRTTDKSENHVYVEFVWGDMNG